MRQKPGVEVLGEGGERVDKDFGIGSFDAHGRVVGSAADAGGAGVTASGPGGVGEGVDESDVASVSGSPVATEMWRTPRERSSASPSRRRGRPARGGQAPSKPPASAGMSPGEVEVVVGDADALFLQAHTNGVGDPMLCSWAAAITAALPARRAANVQTLGEATYLGAAPGAVRT